MGLLTDLLGDGNATSAPRSIFQTGRYYTTPGASVTSTTPTQSRLRVARFDIDGSQRFDRVGTQVATAAASTTLRWLIYNDVDGIPSGAPVLDHLGTADNAATTGFKEATIDLTLDTGSYWVGVVPQGGNPGLISHVNANLPGLALTTAEIEALSGGGMAGFYMNGVTGAGPTFSITGASANAPAVWMRAAAPL